MNVLGKKYPIRLLQNAINAENHSIPIPTVGMLPATCYLSSVKNAGRNMKDAALRNAGR